MDESRSSGSAPLVLPGAEQDIALLGRELFRRTRELRQHGDAALDRRTGMLAMFSGVWRDVHERARAEEPSLRALPDETFTILTAGLEELIRDCLRTRGPAALPGLADPILRAVFAIFGDAGPPG